MLFLKVSRIIIARSTLVVYFTCLLTGGGFGYYFSSSRLLSIGDDSALRSVHAGNLSRQLHELARFGSAHNASYSGEDYSDLTKLHGMEMSNVIEYIAGIANPTRQILVAECYLNSLFPDNIDKAQEFSFRAWAIFAINNRVKDPFAEAFIQHDPLAALQYLGSGDPNFQDRAIKAWLQHDPSAAIHYLSQRHTNEPGAAVGKINLASSAEVVCKSLSGTSPEQQIQILTNQGVGDELALTTVVSQLADASFTRALQWMQESLDLAQQESALPSMLSKLPVSTSTKDLNALLGFLPTNQLHEKAIERWVFNPAKSISSRLREIDEISDLRLQTFARKRLLYAWQKFDNEKLSSFLSNNNIGSISTFELGSDRRTYTE